MHFWQAEYDNGMLHTEPVASYHELDRDRVAYFRIVDEDGRKVAAMKVPPEATFFHRRRVLQAPGASSEFRLIGFWVGSLVRMLLIREDGVAEYREAFTPNDVLWGEITMFGEERADRLKKAVLCG